MERVLLNSAAEPSATRCATVPLCARRCSLTFEGWTGRNACRPRLLEEKSQGPNPLAGGSDRAHPSANWGEMAACGGNAGRRERGSHNRWASTTSASAYGRGGSERSWTPGMDAPGGPWGCTGALGRRGRLGPPARLALSTKEVERASTIPSSRRDGGSPSRASRSSSRSGPLVRKAPFSIGSTVGAPRSRPEAAGAGAGRRSRRPEALGEGDGGSSGRRPARSRAHRRPDSPGTRSSSRSPAPTAASARGGLPRGHEAVSSSSSKGRVRGTEGTEGINRLMR